jgi:hypothetical protein
MGRCDFLTQTRSLPQGQERLSWSCAPSREKRVPRPPSNERREKAEHRWKQKLWHLSNRHFACQADAEAALKRALKGLPIWLEVQSEFVSSAHQTGKGRPRTEATPTMQWRIQATVSVKHPQVEQAARRKACFIVATTVLDASILSDQELVTTSTEQGSVERGLRFLRISLVPGLHRVCQKAGAHRRSWLAHGALLDFSIVWPSIGCAHVWPKQSKPFLIGSTDRRLVLPCDGSFKVLRASSSCISTRHLAPSRSSYVCCLCIASSCLCSDLPLKKSTKFLRETAKCGY